MALCNGCGGVVGRDCFNPEECEWISRSMERESLLREAEERAAYAVRAEMRARETDRLLGEVKAVEDELASTPRWRWLRRANLRRAWMAAVSVVEAHERGRK